jgi:hypothetical protein
MLVTSGTAAQPTSPALRFTLNHGRGTFVLRMNAEPQRSH